MMNPEWKKKWLEALRSGKYVQGQNVLRSDGNRYCCLGVLCDLQGEGAWDAKNPGRPAGLNTNYTYLTGPLCLAFGLSDKEQCTLSDLNDVAEAPFSEIANWIEANL